MRRIFSQHLLCFSGVMLAIHCGQAAFTTVNEDPGISPMSVPEYAMMRYRGTGHVGRILQLRCTVPAASPAISTCHMFNPRPFESIYSMLAAAVSL